MERYGIIEEKRKREIVLLRGRGCAYKKCSFCDYHYDMCADENENYALNKSVLERVTGAYGELEVINSGSVFELDGNTLALIKSVCAQKGIGVLHFEAHYMYRKKISSLRKYFDGIELKMKLGLETFDYEFRENVLKKGIRETSPEAIAESFDEANFLFGVSGQTVESMLKDVELGLKYFERICINIMCPNSTAVSPDKEVIALFVDRVYPLIHDNDRVDVLLENTDFGVGD